MTQATDLTYKQNGNMIEFMPHSEWGVSAWRNIIPPAPFNKFDDGSAAVGFCLAIHLASTLRQLRKAGGVVRKALTAAERASLASGPSGDDLLAELMA